MKKRLRLDDFRRLHRIRIGAKKAFADEEAIETGEGFWQSSKLLTD